MKKAIQTLATITKLLNSIAAYHYFPLIFAQYIDLQITHLIQDPQNRPFSANKRVLKLFSYDF